MPPHWRCPRYARGVDLRRRATAASADENGIAKGNLTLITTIISAVILGAIIGALARLVLPGKQNISVLITIVIGILGALIGSWVTQAVGYHNHKGFAWIPFIVGVVVAAILIVIYGSITGRRQTTT